MRFMFSGSSLRGRLIRGPLSFLIASVTTQTMGMIASILCARVLDREAFGELSMVRTTVLMFGVLAGTGLGMAATKFVAESRDTDRARAGRHVGLLMNVGLVTGAGTTLLCVVTAGPLAIHALGAAHLSDALMVGAVMLLFNTLNG